MYSNGLHVEKYVFLLWGGARGVYLGPAVLCMAVYVHVCCVSACVCGMCVFGKCVCVCVCRCDICVVCVYVKCISVVLDMFYFSTV